MGTVPVTINCWEIECCGEPFSVGDRVTWRLTWAPEAKLPDELFVTLDATVETVPVTNLPRGDQPAVRRYQRFVRAGQIQATWSGSGSLSGHMTLRGVLLATWHGGGLEPTSPSVSGFVHRIRTLRQRMQISAGRPRRREALVAGSELIDMPDCPHTFDDFGDRADSGVVVDLKVVAPPV
ncbi:DUF6578 domain-containing protein [Amycolatopsis sp. YIM 10]|uniref:DUF6578 domain-containing protein n=1 Tax=Amycolatopsis sp. YIM 10 TaxID=2653857 RepID=UPI00129033C5|nr:DUF6578 domain-containing protein [Amycolatopsis sp. YIM 10]QFU86629.1 hypothetical protein YIM_07090 [Amycolatopsis sp. YIM 10]